MKTTEFNHKASYRQDFIMIIVLTVILFSLVAVSVASPVDGISSVKKSRKKSKNFSGIVYKRTYANSLKSIKSSSFSGGYTSYGKNSDAGDVDMNGNSLSLNFLEALGFSSTELVTTSSYGMRTAVNLTIDNEILQFEIGTFAGYKGRIVSGMNSVLKYNFVNKSRFQVFAYGQFVYDSKAILDQRILENMYGSNLSNKEVTFKTTEEYAGLGISRNIGSCFAMNLSVGFGAYQSKVNSDKAISAGNAIRENKAFAFSSSLGIAFKF